MIAQNLKVCIKTEGLDDMKKLIQEANEKITELEKVLQAINNTEVKIIVEPAKEE